MLIGNLRRGKIIDALEDRLADRKGFAVEDRRSWVIFARAWPLKPTLFQPGVAHSGARKPNLPDFLPNLRGRTEGESIFEAHSLGHQLMSQRKKNQPVSGHMLISHTHWDHIQGIPFFAPIYFPHNRVSFYAGSSGKPLEETLEGQMAKPYFPIDFAQVAAERENVKRVRHREVALNDAAGVQPDHRLPNLHLRFIMQGGPLFEDAGKRGATALLATIAAEMLAGSSGLGHLLFEAGFSMRTAEMFGLMLLIGVSGLLLNGFIGLVRRLLVGWHMRLAAMAES